MIAFKDFLLEGSAEVNLSKKLLKNLSDIARYSITNWEWANWDKGDLSKAYREKNDIYDEIEAQAKILRDAIRKREGKSITLYRGIVNKDIDSQKFRGRILTSWTSRAKVAALFAGITMGMTGNKIVMKGENSFTKLEGLTKSQAQKIQDTVKRDGYAKIGNFLFKRKTDNPEWTVIFIKSKYGNRRLPDDDAVETDDIARWLLDRIEDALKLNRPYEDEGFVIKKEISVDDIVWVLNAGGTMEYIVKNHSSIDGIKIGIEEFS